jgi:tRNA G18 (ribose-2'-O)-methylase SpoU
MPRHSIGSLDDPRLDPYRNLTQTNLTRWSGQFIAEGRTVVRRLVESDLRTQSVLIADHRADEAFTWIPESIETLVVPLAVAQELVGYNFHAGYLACGVRPDPPVLDRYVTNVLSRDQNDRQTVVVCPNVTDPENIGAIIRIAVCFGVDLLILGRGCSDPFSRRVLRVSMGTAFRLPILESDDLVGDIQSLQVRGKFELMATAIDPAAVPLHRSSRPSRVAILLGNEAHGLGPEWIARCDRTVAIPMAPGADSLNVAVATGIFLHHFRYVESIDAESDLPSAGR